MRVEAIQSLVQKSPFRPVEILLHGGETIVVSHPKSIFFANTIVVVRMPDGTDDFFDPDAVSRIRRLSGRNRSRRSKS